MSRYVPTSLDPAPLLARVEGLTEEEAGRRLGVSASTIHMWRHKGRRVRETTADRVATDLGLHLDILWPRAAA